MRIAIFSSTAEPKDGYGNITHELITHLAQLGVDLTVFLPKSQKGKGNLPCKTRCILPEYIFRIYQPKALGYFSTIDVSEFDLVHSLFAFPYCILGARSAKKYNKPFVMGAQGTHGVRPLTYFPEKLFLKKAYAQASSIVVPSAFTKQKIWEHSGVEYPIDVFHNGVHFDRFQKSVDTNAIRSQYEGKKILLTVGGLWGRKGHDLVLRSIAQMQRNDIVYVIVGDGNGRTNLEKLAEELGIRDCVDFVGRKSGDELVAYFQACDVYVHTPKVVDLKFEGFGIVYLEASACGKPIVATDAGGIRDAVIDNETGLIAADGDIEGIAKRILTLLDDESQAKRLGENGRSYAKKNSWPAIALHYDNLYKKVATL